MQLEVPHVSVLAMVFRSSRISPPTRQQLREVLKKQLWDRHHERRLKKLWTNANKALV